MNNKLESAILAAAVQPLAYPEIEARIGRQPRFVLGGALARLVAQGRLRCKVPAAYSKHWPVYCVMPIPKRFAYPKRNGVC